MDSGTVTAFCDAAAQLLPAIGEFVAIPADQCTPDDDALVRQLRVAAGALANALMEVSRMVPPPSQRMPPPQLAPAAASAPGAPSAA